MYSQTLVESTVMYFGDMLHVQSNIGGICCDVIWGHPRYTNIGEICCDVQSNIGEICCDVIWGHPRYTNIGEICCDVFWRHAPCTVKHW